jgi:hypothetical protein
VIVALSDVRKLYDALMAHVAIALGAGLGQQLYVTRVIAKLSAEEVANGAGLNAELLDAFEAGATPTTRKRRRSRRQSLPSVGCPAWNISSIRSLSITSTTSHTSTAGMNRS